MSTFYEVLGVSNSATFEEIDQAYNDKLSELYVLKNSGSITEEEFNKRFDDLDKVYGVLSNSTERASYDEYIARKAGGRGPQRNDPRTDSQADYDDNGKHASKKGLGKKIAVGAVAVVTSVSILAAGFFAYKYFTGAKLNDLNNRPPYGQTQDGLNSNSPTITPGSDGVIIPDNNGTIPDGGTLSPDGLPNTTPDGGIDDNGSSNNENNDGLYVDSSISTEKMPQLVNYGDINDSTLVEQRATNLVNQLNAAGLYNMATNKPYTVEEIKEVMQYVCGNYKPEDEVEAMNKVNDLLNLALAPLNSDTFIFTVGYQSGEDSFKSVVEENAANFKKVDFVGNLLYGNSMIGPYLEWLQDQYCAMQTTTDRDECNKIYNSVIQSLADFSFGDGFYLDGKIYKEGMALGNDKVNSGNVLQFLVYVIEPFRTARANDYYVVTNKYISANPDDNKVNVPYLQVSEWFTPLCDYETYQFDDEGYLLIDQVGVPEAGIEQDPQTGHNFASINQMNTINRLLEHLYGKDIADRQLIYK